MYTFVNEMSKVVLSYRETAEKKKYLEDVAIKNNMKLGKLMGYITSYFKQNVTEIEIVKIIKNEG